LQNKLLQKLYHNKNDTESAKKQIERECHLQTLDHFHVNGEHAYTCNAVAHSHLENSFRLGM